MNGKTSTEEPGAMASRQFPDQETEYAEVRELCHDLIEPAMTIELLAKVAQIESAASPALALRLHQIIEEAQRISEICDHSIDRTPTPVPMRLDILIGDHLNGQRFRYQGLFDVLTEPVMTVAPAPLITRIISNLLADSCRAAGPGGRVQLVVEGGSGIARIRVAHSDAGMDQVTAGRDGLSHSIVERLLRECGGDIAESDSDLGGREVIVTLPGGAGSRPTHLLERKGA